ncbi:protein AGENET DOMAIN (AGD)-CONTAINING P1-like [Phragmites australis]|uniref:protein AGENET DOMAIN (AGD)-CONTAINING P1-like n=1 Tax=Phragmites australis TaxID=29695 RepID=UPI002D76917D|nr:protein AGENET DOMAIN (AGD)-CONTAINING P1-like [Phragmites australis]
MRTPRSRRRSPPPLPEAADGFNPGDPVEVLPDEPGLRGVHFAAVVVRSNPKPRSYTVDYDALVDSEGSDRPLRETVPARNVRPRPPPLRAPASGEPPAEHAAVDALLDDAWWLGVALGGADGTGKVAVCFPETREVVEFDAAGIRPHLEWVDGEWRSPDSTEIPKTMPYTKGTQIEVAKLEDNSVVAWLPAVVAKTIWKNNLLVEYTVSKSDGTALSEEIVNVKHVRPCPPHASAISFCINDEVEAFQGDGWWLGVITDVHPELRYTFKSAHSEKEVQMEQKLLRLRYDWVDGQWTQESQNILKAKFTQGIKVEISSDEEGLRGAWFEATVLKSVGSKFLVEYDTLKADDENKPLTEAVEVRHIRPSPPRIPVINGFKLLDEVDAFWNDGWWVGVVSKVLGDQRYMVYFRPWKEEMEFEHGQLRFHCDWMGGRWMRASPALEM